MRVRLFSDIAHVMTKIDWEGTCTSSHACTLSGLKNMMTYERVKPATVGPAANTNLELKMLCLIYFVLESEKIVIMSWWETILFFPFLFFLFLFPNVNWFLGPLIPQFINVIAPNNDLLIDEMNVIYFAPKWWLYVMIWLPPTTDNSTYFAQSLGILGIESRLYYNIEAYILWVCVYIKAKQTNLL